MIYDLVCVPVSYAGTAVYITFPSRVLENIEMAIYKLYLLSRNLLCWLSSFHFDRPEGGTLKSTHFQDS